MQIVKYTAFAILALLILLVLRQWKGESPLLVRLAVTVLFGGAALSAAAPLLQYLRTLMGMGNASPYAELLFKALGIATLTQIAASVCRDCGEGSVADGVELVGRIELLLLSLPLIAEILNAAQELMRLGG
ncbi:MAG: hypothetical protein E7666_02950 [Ruminococcaceae bacterium]|nr:hypothetical protein [Oscillospiraceae bacterium]